MRRHHIQNIFTVSSKSHQASLLIKIYYCFLLKMKIREHYVVSGRVGFHSPERRRQRRKWQESLGMSMAHPRGHFLQGFQLLSINKIELFHKIVEMLITGVDMGL